MYIKLTRFGGMAPQYGARDLPDHSAQKAQNARLWTHDLVPFKRPRTVFNLSRTETVRSIYPLSGGDWMAWPDYVDVRAAPIANDSHGRLYFTGHLNPKVTNEALAKQTGTDFPSDYYQLGLPAPDDAPTVGHTGGTGGSETRSYIYRWKTNWGERGPPSPAGSHTGVDDATSWDISGLDTTPPNSFNVTAISLSDSTLTLTTENQHHLETGQYVTISGVNHYAELNGTHRVTRVDATSFSVEVGITTLNLVTNGDFEAGDVNWVKGTGWTIGSGVASSDGTGSATDLSQDIGAEIVKYKTVFDVLNHVSGQVRIGVGSAFGPPRSSDGTFTEQITGGGGTDVDIRSVSGAEFTGDVDNVVVEEAPDDWTVSREAEIQTVDLKTEIYRADANGDFRFVGETDATQSVFTDTVANTALGEVLPDEDWIAPPGDMHSLDVLENGAMVGASGKQVCFAEPFQPHAWPSEYRYTLPFEIQRVIVWGNSVVAITKGKHSILTGQHPSSMSEDQLDINHSGNSPRSVTALDTGVSFAAPDGLVHYNGNPTLLTEPLMERKDWQLFAPSTLLGVTHDDRYIGFYTGGGEDGNEDAAIVLDPQERFAELFLVALSATAVYEDMENDRLYLVRDGVIEEFDAGGLDMAASFLSKIFVMPRKVTLTAGKVRFTASAIPQEEADQMLADAIQLVRDDNLSAGPAAGHPSQSGAMANFPPAKFTVCGGPYVDAINDNKIQGSSVTVKLIANGSIIHSESVSDTGVFRVTPVGKFDEYEIEVSCVEAHVHEVMFAENRSEFSRG